MGIKDLSKRRGKISKRRSRMSNRRSNVAKRRNKVSKRKSKVTKRRSRLFKYGGMVPGETHGLNAGETYRKCSSFNGDETSCNSNSNCFWGPSRLPGRGNVCLTKQRTSYHFPKTQINRGRIDRKRYENYIRSKTPLKSLESPSRNLFSLDTHACKHKPEWRKVGDRTPRNLILPRFQSYHNLIKTNQTYPEICVDKNHRHLNWSDDMGYCCGSTEDNQDDFKNYLIFMIEGATTSTIKSGRIKNTDIVLAMIEGLIDRLKPEDQTEVRQLLIDSRKVINDISSKDAADDSAARVTFKQSGEKDEPLPLTPHYSPNVANINATWNKEMDDGLRKRM